MCENGARNRATAYLRLASQAQPRLTRQLEQRELKNRQQQALLPRIQATLESDPTHPTARLDLAITLAWLEQWGEAETILVALLKENPSDTATRLQLSALYRSKGLFVRALETLDSGRTGDFPVALDCHSARLLWLMPLFRRSKRRPSVLPKPRLWRKLRRICKRS